MAFDSFSHLYLLCQCLFTLENIEYSPLFVTNINEIILPPFDQRHINFLSLLW